MALFGKLAISKCIGALTLFLLLGVSGSVNSAPLQWVHNKQQIEEAQLERPADFSTFRGDPQRNGVFSNGGMPPLQGQLWQRFQRDRTIWAPIIAGDKLVFTVEDQGLYEADTMTGDVKLLKQGDVGFRLDPPMYQNGTLYYAWLDGFHAMDMKTKQDIWAITSAAKAQFNSPAIPASTIYFNNLGLLEAADGSTGEVRWVAQFAQGLSYDQVMAEDDGVIYFLADYDRTQPGSDVLDFQVNLYAADAQTGQELWRYEPPGSEDMSGYVESPIVGNGIVYCATREDAYAGPGRVFAFDGRNVRKLWEQPIADLTRPGPLAYSNGLVYVATDGSSPIPALSYRGTSAALHALDGKTGTERWSFVKGDDMSPPSISGQTLYITVGTSGDNAGDTLYALDSTTGKVLRQMQLRGGVTNPIVIDHGTILYSAYDPDSFENWISAIR